MSESQDEAMVRSIARECDQCAVGVIPFVPLDRVRWLLAEIDRLRAERKDALAERDHSEACISGFRREAERLRAENHGYRDRIPVWQGELDRLRAENEKLSTRVTELAVGEACFTPSGVDELLRLRAENEKLRSALVEVATVDIPALATKLTKIAHPEPQEGT